MDAEKVVMTVRGEEIKYKDMVASIGIVSGNFELEWGVEKIGFGRLYFYEGEDEKMHCSNECMSKNFIKAMLCRMVDDMVLDEVWDNKNE